MNILLKEKEDIILSLKRKDSNFKGIIKDIDNTKGKNMILENELIEKVEENEKLKLTIENFMKKNEFHENQLKKEKKNSNEKEEEYKKEIYALKSKNAEIFNKIVKIEEYEKIIKLLSEEVDKLNKINMKKSDVIKEHKLEISKYESHMNVNFFIFSL